MNLTGFRRITACFLAAVMVFSMLFQTVKISAAGSTVKSSGLKTVYLTGSDGYPSGDGSTKEQPLHDINAAFRAAADGGTIVIIDSYVDQKGVTTPEEKKLTIRGEHPSVSLTLRYGITLGSDLKFDRIKLETTSVDEEARRFLCQWIFVDPDRHGPVFCE